jgi:hypothetical protein
MAQIIHLVGEQGSGKSTLAMHIIAADAAQGHRTVLLTPADFHWLHKGDLREVLRVHQPQETLLLECEAEALLPACPGELVIRMDTSVSATLQRLPQILADIATHRAVIASRMATVRKPYARIFEEVRLPQVVHIVGPQGCGKTLHANKLIAHLEAKGRSADQIDQDDLQRRYQGIILHAVDYWHLDVLYVLHQDLAPSGVIPGFMATDQALQWADGAWIDVTSMQGHLAAAAPADVHAAGAA